MATTHLDPGSKYGDQAYADHAYASASSARRSLFPAIRWGAVFAGVAVGVSIQLVLTLLGIATGLSVAEASKGEGVGMGPLVWAGLSMLIAAFVGGYVAARMTGLKRKADGVLHGVVSWAVTTLLFATLATSASGALLSSVFSTVNSGLAAAGAGSAAAAVQPGQASTVLGLVKSQIGGNVSAASLKQLQEYVQNGQRDEAVRHMTGTMGVEQSRAETIVDQALILSGAPDRASDQGKATVERAAGKAGAAAWAVFSAVALSMVLGIIGGVMGAIGARRTTWTDASKASAVNPA